MCGGEGVGSEERKSRESVKFTRGAEMEREAEEIKRMSFLCIKAEQKEMRQNHHSKI